jgi:predicted O-methyltransferase YrrM
MNIPPFQEPAHAAALRILWKLTGRHRRFDTFLTPFLKYRAFLPVVTGEKVIPNFLTSQVSITTPPIGPWATPAGDTLTVIKAVVGFESKRILEIGSYKGNTAKLMAENTGPDTHIFTLDIDPDHGSVFRGTPQETKITRIIGDSSLENASKHAPYDLIFIDGDHGRKGAYRDSLVALEVLSDDGVILWHDYHNTNYFVHRHGAVPEALRLLQAEKKIPIVSIEGTMVAAYSKKPNWETSRLDSSR